MDRQVMETDIVVTGFGPASAGFLLTLAPELAKTKEDGSPLYESKVMPGMPLQVMCYERADDTGFGVSGISLARSTPGKVPRIASAFVTIPETPKPVSSARS